jgi:hypothetical protein
MQSLRRALFLSSGGRSEPACGRDGTDTTLPRSSDLLAMLARQYERRAIALRTAYHAALDEDRLADAYVLTLVAECLQESQHEREHMHEHMHERGHEHEQQHERGHERGHEQQHDRATSQAVGTRDHAAPLHAQPPTMQPANTRPGTKPEGAPATHACKDREQWD